MFPESHPAISSRVGLGFLSSMALAFMTMPGVQKPHCTPPLTTKASANTSRSCADRPSAVVSDFPSRSFIFIRQLSRAMPSTRTVQQPHTPSPEQPSLGLMSPATSRK